MSQPDSAAHTADEVDGPVPTIAYLHQLNLTVTEYPLAKRDHPGVVCISRSAEPANS